MVAFILMIIQFIGVLISILNGFKSSGRPLTDRQKAANAAVLNKCHHLEDVCNSCGVYAADDATTAATEIELHSD